ncbi:MAG: 4Fe-4S dicluster domain-containing protein [Bacteroidota bacterium]
MHKGTHNSYFGNIKEGIKTSIKGLRLSMRHFKNARRKMALVNVNDPNYFSEKNGTVTLQYPNEVIAVPDHGRYRLNNEMDDCIVCDKCAKVCPVDCIDIEPIKSSELIGNASDGSPIRLYAAKFDIDMAKCCFCGLCTTVCPTECLTMSKAYDFSEFDVKDFNYHYANLSPEQAEEKKKNYEQFVLEKEAAKAIKSIPTQSEIEPIVTAKPVFRPAFKKPEIKTEETETKADSKVNENEETPKPAFRPVFKKTEIKVEEKAEEKEEEIIEKAEEAAPKPKPVFRPVFKKPTPQEPVVEAEIPKELSTEEPTAKPKPVFRPVFKKPTTQEPVVEAEIPKELSTEEPTAKPKPVFRPVFKKPVPQEPIGEAELPNEAPIAENQPRPKPVFRPAVRKPKEE